ncbi:pyruvate decarboxylase, variant 2 [Blastomyces gilchristii SLH14081]|uniref:Pyruvate decarboxylase n=1 Tax=Blastomyces gilchristii (strain SLH14081) TaxID=559298 RepID=A0A179UIH7_BLAGS|nr:pyruvate decarboxylase, variant 1 [Blastomyces gilchristii SLH14081]XP_031577567.1 pyruvate decarboxylase [Blastomyces gilchristii SLH14081]XP_031577568.1 pyruvate decarboxylase, variant 2 [Blastomyces gilchristii SLH14081]OAT07056.1 pyruvate decarboxylase [Blastomyces gilchristii SLH14081]OAT07057.1 pyruvate decarboxylase, variant 1 [Blastomyces gilchristii SLH14081]OAT07058.1 pyruvate decarboxylase, variant 2 [Blastomyces gilchristii SLH14081]
MAADIPRNELKSPVDVAQYLFTRLRQVGIRSVHGLPGDYNLVALDYLPNCGLEWVGNCNELNAGYAADGYARVNGMGALVTTFGVGELSALNAIAGSFSEYVPVVHIVGQPSTASQRDGMLLHHTLGNGDFNVFVNMSANISCYVAKLNDPHEAAALIDSAIRECWIRSRPVYITLPTDMVKKKVEGERLKVPIDLKRPDNEEEKEEYVVDVVLKYLHAAKSPVILIDACAIRHRVLNEVHDLVTRSGLPTFVTPMGKSAIDETLPNYGGVYAGDGSSAGVKELVESSDLILNIGAIKSDFNTTGFTYRIGRMNSIDFHSTYVAVRYSEYPNIHMKGVLRKVADRMGELNTTPGRIITNQPPKHELRETSSAITHAWFWPTVGRWLREKDVIITETGTANFGIWETRFPKGVIALSQVLWGSIGYALGACQGAALATKEKNQGQRTILFIGDGSFQLTAQELSTIIRHNLTPIIFVICNDGYTIERCIHGWDAVYNDIQPWKFSDLVPAFGAKPNTFKTHSIKTEKELTALFADESFSSSKVLQLVELHIPKEDAPAALRLTAEAAANASTRHK